MDSFEREEVSDTFNSTSSKRFDKYPVEGPETELDASRLPFVASGEKLSMIFFSRFLLFRLLERRRFLFFFLFKKKRLVGAAWRARERKAPTTKEPAMAAIMLVGDGVMMARVLLWCEFCVEKEIVWRRFSLFLKFLVLKSEKKSENSSPIGHFTVKFWNWEFQLLQQTSKIIVFYSMGIFIKIANGR